MNGKEQTLKVTFGVDKIKLKMKNVGTVNFYSVILNGEKIAIGVETNAQYLNTNKTSDVLIFNKLNKAISLT